jgi:hypothetical protein
VVSKPNTNLKYKKNYFFNLFNEKIAFEQKIGFLFFLWTQGNTQTSKKASSDNLFQAHFYYF